MINHPAATHRTGGRKVSHAEGAMLGEAWLAMGANRLRTFLTMLGMVIGVGAVVLMMAIGQGAQSRCSSPSHDGQQHVHRALRLHLHGGVRSGGGNAPTLTVADAEAIAELRCREAAWRRFTRDRRR
jgi:putative ABC transport system permease protein